MIQFFIGAAAGIVGTLLFGAKTTSSGSSSTKPAKKSETKFAITPINDLPKIIRFFDDENSDARTYQIFTNKWLDVNKETWDYYMADLGGHPDDGKVDYTRKKKQEGKYFVYYLKLNGKFT